MSGTYNPLIDSTYVPPTPYIISRSDPVSPIKDNCSAIGKVHHFHREPIECLDTKTVEDPPKIDKCCRCGFEQDIQKPDTLNCTMKRPPIPRPVQPTIAKAERSEADALMKVYNEKRQKRLQKEALKFANGK